MNSQRIDTAPEETSAVIGAHHNLRILGNYLVRLKTAVAANDIGVIQQVLGNAEVLVDATLNDLQQVVPVDVAMEMPMEVAMDAPTDAPMDAPVEMPAEVETPVQPPIDSEQQDIDLNILVGKTIHALSQDIPRASDITFNLGCISRVTGNKADLQRLVQEVLLNTGLEDEDDRTNIIVTTQTAAKFACITIRDDGPEMTDDEITEFLSPCDENRDAYAPCQAIVDSHQGRIKVTSSHESGTCVDIFLPISSD
jgi:hypothetical protein